MPIRSVAENGGEGGIRTLGRFDPPSDFKSGALSQTLPPLLIKRGADCPNRTGDLLITSQLLYLLS